MNEVCKHHEAVEQCAKAAKTISITNSDELKKKIGWPVFVFVIGGLAAMGLILFMVATTQISNVRANTLENSRLFHRIDKNIEIIANHVGCEDKIRVDYK